jgi:hypothetical protein
MAEIAMHLHDKHAAYLLQRSAHVNLGSSRVYNI